MTHVLKAWENTLKVNLKGPMTLESLRNRENIFEKKLKEKTKELYKINDCSPLKTFLTPWVQVPLFISLSLTLRKMSAFPIPWIQSIEDCKDLVLTKGFDTEGIYWFINLSEPDPFVLLPFITSALHLTNIELQFQGSPEVMKYKLLKLCFRVVSLLIIPIGTQLPSVRKK
ncbi:Cytochrome c oxidase assembly protein cox18, mitochondrial [Lobulomyces angularis]|nr:Cytochrome c oxidase assembly protein cox18, mitochondrial [Lobulomyces angularis]